MTFKVLVQTEPTDLGDEYANPMAGLSYLSEIEAREAAIQHTWTRWPDDVWCRFKFMRRVSIEEARDVRAK